MSKKKKKLSTKDLLDFTSNLSLLLNSGLSLHNSINMINSFTRKKQLKELSEYLDQGLKKGSSLSQLIEKENFISLPLYRGLINIGDRIGSLASILPTLQTYLERKKNIRDKIINASIYPFLVLLMLFFGLIFLIVFVSPKLEELFSGLGNSEMQTSILKQNISQFEVFGLVFIIIIICLLLIFPLRQRYVNIRAITDRFLVRTPGIRHIVLSLELFNFTFAVETLTKHGIPLSSAIKEAIPVCHNHEVSKIFSFVHKDLTTGKSLYAAFSNQKYLPDRIKQWIGIGENTGKTDIVFNQLRIYYEAEIDNLTSRLLVIIEPILIIFVGIIVISLIFTFIVPMFSLFGTII